MQQNHDELAQMRERTHAKLFTVENRQVVAYLNRDDSDDLSVILQLWVASTDEQLRIALRGADDALTQLLFDDLTDERLQTIFNELQVNETIQAAARG